MDLAAGGSVLYAEIFGKFGTDHVPSTPHFVTKAYGQTIKLYTKE